MNRPDYGTCPACGHLTLPVLDLPPCGHDDTPTVTPLQATGTVYSWTRSWHGQESTVIAMADFLDGLLRVTAPVVDAIDISIGDSVQAEVGQTTPYVLRTRPVHDI